MLDNLLPLIHQLHEQDFVVIDNFLPENYSTQLYNLAQSNYAAGEFKQARVGHNPKQEQIIRRDQTLWLDQGTDQAVDIYFAYMQDLARVVNQTLFLGLAHFEAHFAVYQPGDFYRKHRDQFDQSSARKLSCVYYLNPTWQPSFGGALQLYDQQDKPLQTVLPCANRLICFNSKLPHEVCVTHQPRYSIAAWFKTRSTRLL